MLYENKHKKSIISHSHKGCVMRFSSPLFPDERLVKRKWGVMRLGSVETPGSCYNKHKLRNSRKTSHTNSTLVSWIASPVCTTSNTLPLCHFFKSPASVFKRSTHTHTRTRAYTHTHAHRETMRIQRNAHTDLCALNVCRIIAWWNHFSLSSDK